MKKIFLFAALAATTVMSLTSCSSDEDCPNINAQNIEKGRLIRVNPLSNGMTSRGTAITGSNYLNTDLVPSMKVWAFFRNDVTEGDGVVKGGQYVGNGGDGIIINNNSSGSTSLWNYANVADQAYWPKEALDFIALIPATDACYGEVSANYNTSSPLGMELSAELNIPTNVTAQKDIMYALADNQTRTFSETVAPVDFTFHHILSQIVFSGKCAAEKISVDVQDIKICNAVSNGTYEFKYDATETDYADFMTLGDNYGKYSVGLIDNATLDGTVNKTTAKNLTADNGALMLLSQNRTTDKWSTTPSTAVSIATADANHQTYLAITCKIKNDNVYLVGGESTYQTVYIPFEINWDINKKYVYTLVFGAGAGAYDEDGNPLDSMLPITYTVSAPVEWTEVDGGEVEF